MPVILLVLALVVAIVPELALAAPAAPECDPDDPAACSTPMKKGEVAPYAGQLLTPALAIRLGQAAEHCDDKIAIEIAHTSSTAKVDLDFEKKLRAIDVRQLTRERDAVETDRDFWKGEASRKVEPSPWYEHPAFVAPVAVLAMIGAVLLAVEIVEARDQRIASPP